MAEVVEPQEQEEIKTPEAEVEVDTETPESAEAEEQTPEAEEQPEVEGSPEAEAAAAETAEEEAPESETEPFGFTADRRRFEVPGAAVVKFKDESGNTVEKIVLDRDAWNRFVQPQIRDQAALQRRDAEHRRELAARDPERNETVIRARTLLASMEQVLTSEETLTAFLQDFDRNKEIWQLKADKAVSDAKINGYSAQETEQQTTARMQQEAELVATELPEVIQAASQFVSDNYKISVDQRALQAASQHVSENIGTYYRYATPLDAQNYGVEQGTLIRDDDAVIRTIHRFASLLSEQGKVEAVKAKNKAALSGGKPVPKTVSAKGAPASGGKPKKFKTREEWIAYMGGHS